MKTGQQILRDLRTGQATATALAERLPLPCKVIEAFLQDLETDGLVESSPIGNPDVGRKLTVWKITEAGHLSLT